MNIKDYIANYKNHPILFVGTGISKRYLENSFTWDGLLKKIAFELNGDNEYYLDLKYKYRNGDSEYDYSQIALHLENDFNESLEENRHGKFKIINNRFYEYMENDIHISRFKLYIAELLSDTSLKEEKKKELEEFRKIRKNISSIITTNYDLFIENTFEFMPLIGNNILLSNPYGSAYKIHGCVSYPNEIIITEDDYRDFDKKYELIRAQLLSLFIHNPIIFLGYSIEDKNIKKILKTIFSYVNPSSDIATKIRNNFLLVEYEEGSEDTNISDYDIKLENFPLIRINKLKTDNFTEIYKAISDLHLSISAMDIRKVQNIVKEIREGGDIKVHITEDLDKLSNSDKVLAIGSAKTITYDYQTSSEMMNNYFDIIDDENKQLLVLIDKQKIQSQQYFPIFAFSLINPDINSSDKLKAQQTSNLTKAIETITKNNTKIVLAITSNTTISDILINDDVTRTNKLPAILFAVMKNYITLDDLEQFLKSHKDKSNSDYRKLLCAYDLKKYGEQ
jgi:hypothetical protein